MKSIKKWFSIFYLYFGLSFLINIIISLMVRGRKRILILVYHGVGDESLNIEDNIPFENFARQLDYLLKNFVIVSFDDAVDYLQGSQIDKKKPLVVLTFDDAYQSIYANVYPLLKERKIPATVFVPVGYVGKNGSWPKEEGYYGAIMDWEMLKQLAKDPLITIGSHGMKHVRLSSLGANDIKRELEDSKSILEEKLKSAVRYFCYPYGQAKECTPAIISALKTAGYKAAGSAIFGRFSSPADIFRLRRVAISYHDSFLDFRLKVSGGYDWLELYHVLKSKGY